MKLLPFKIYSGFLLAAMLLSVPALKAGAPAQVIDKFSVTDESRLSVHITTNVNEFSCATESVRGSGYYRGNSARNLNLIQGAVYNSLQGQGVLFTMVNSFKCPRPMMDRDMQSLLRAEQSPSISFFLESLELIKTSSGQASGAKIKGRGSLSIAGETRMQDFTGEVEFISSSVFKIKTIINIRLPEFKIAAPKKFFGLVKVEDELQIVAELVVTRKAFSGKVISEYLPKGSM